MLRKNKLFLVVFVFLFTSSLLLGEDVMMAPFKSLDLNQKEITSDIFKNADLTMINIWATFCPPCLDELPALGKLAKEYKSKKVQIIGIAADANSVELLELAKEIVDKTKADFIHILPSEDIVNLKLKQVSVVPETIFVNKNGKIVGESVIGSRSESQWREIIEQRLKDHKGK
ncbi:TlpA family protein disulfide reductase [Fusobacterium sp. PH5-44]|uniref:TlpA family protein disulfide reductase n=1 Tax=unclassified Fusobacterium TaxID=2648384 RepID=UPI003D1CF1BB